MKKNKFQYSKILPLITFVLFFGSVVKCFSVDISSAYDLSVYATIITTTGTLCLTAIVWYLKNSQAEKVARIKADTYRIASEERYRYNEKMLKLQHKYKFTEEEITNVENNSYLDEFEQDALYSMNSSVDSAMEEATSPIDAQNI